MNRLLKMITAIPTSGLFLIHTNKKNILFRGTILGGGYLSAQRGSHHTKHGNHGRLWLSFLAKGGWGAGTQGYSRREPTQVQETGKKANPFHYLSYSIVGYGWLGMG